MPHAPRATPCAAKLELDLARLLQMGVTAEFARTRLLEPRCFLQKISTLKIFNALLLAMVLITVAMLPKEAHAALPEFCFLQWMKQYPYGLEGPTGVQDGPGHGFANGVANVLSADGSSLAVNYDCVESTLPNGRWNFQDVFQIKADGVVISYTSRPVYLVSNRTLSHPDAGIITLGSETKGPHKIELDLNGSPITASSFRGWDCSSYWNNLGPDLCTSEPNPINVTFLAAGPPPIAPKLKITKTAVGGVGVFNFTITGTLVDSDTIAATTPGETFTGLTTIVGTGGTAIGISERPVANFPASGTSVSCTDANAGNAVVASATGTTSVTIPATKVTLGADITCAYTNTFVAPKARVSLNKAANQAVFVAGATDQSYRLTLTVAGNPTSGAISIADNLPNGLVLAGVPTINAGTLTGCSGSGASLGTCTVSPGLRVGSYTITVPVNVQSPATANTVTNSATITPTSDTCVTCTSAASTPVLDAIDDAVTKTPGVATSTNVGTNDILPSGSTFTVTGGTCANPGPVSPAANTSGLLTYTLPTGSNNCTVIYKLCAPAPTSEICDTATLTASAILPMPTITVSKALASVRGNSSDQFTVQITSNGSTAASSTTQGSGSTVVVGTGSIARFAATVGTSYAIDESMAAGSNSLLANYSGSLSCTNSRGTTLPSALGAPFTVQMGDTINCTLTNSLKPVTLTVRQLTLSPVPPNLAPPFTFGYSGTNGLTVQTLTNPAFNVPVLGSPQTLTAFNTATTLTVANFPDNRWLVGGFSCIDTNAPGSGNPTGNLVSIAANSITVPAANVRPGAALRCTALMRHPVP